MKTAEELQVYIEDILQDAYRQPAMYGPTPLETEVRLSMLHWIWAELTGRRDELNAITLEVTPEEYSSVAGSFHRLFDLVCGSPEGEVQRMAFIVDKWKSISSRLGIAISE